MRNPSCRRQCHRRKRTEEQQDKECLPSFCKIISSSTIADGQLGIPKKFFTKYGKYMSNVVVLKVHSCMAWRVELRKVDGFACFQNGWKEFVEHYSICAGHYLVFRYDRKSQFDVIIFGMSGNEIDYSRSSNNLVESNHVKHVLLPENEGEDGNEGDDSIDKDDTSGGGLMTRRLVKTEERKGAIQIASPFKSKYPFFKITMQPSYVNAKYWRIPRIFSERYLPEGLESLSLQVPNGKKKWVVGCYLYRGIDLRIIKGLPLFMLENNIQIGDVCYFELIKKKNVVLKVSVIGNHMEKLCTKQLNHVKNGCVLGKQARKDSAARGNTSKRVVQSIKTEVGGVTQAASSFTTERPFFRVYMTPSYVNRKYMPLPITFYRNYLQGLRGLTLQVSNAKKKWLVNLNPYDSQVRMSGVAEFLSETSIKIGDICFFELINKKDYVLKVTIASQD